MYSFVRTVARIVVHSFFREVTVLNRERIPLYGPVIFVGNHNNQFVDASMLLALIPRHVRFLIAEKSLKRAVIGPLSQMIGSISVSRAQDKVYRGLGLIYWEEGTTTVKGIGSHFLLDMHPGDRFLTMNNKLSITVKAIVSNTEAKVVETLPSMGLNDQENADLQKISSPSDTKLEEEPITEGLPFSILPRVNHADVYETVSSVLISGCSIGIFPEGGSHDQLQLLPLKPGVAIMALSAAAEGAQDILIVPLGLTYYEADKFLSRAIIQVGTPLALSDSLISLYQQNRKEAIKTLLSQIEREMRSCVVSVTDYKTLKLVRLCITLYVPESQFLLPNQYYALYNVFSVLLSKYKDNENVREFVKNAKEYAALLKSYGIADHEVQQLKQSAEEAIFHIIQFLGAFLFSAIIGLIPCLLWGPLGIISNYLAEKHRKKALAESTVKVTGRDVVASYKILTLIILVPTFNLFYSFIFGFLLCSSWSMRIFCIILGLSFLPFIYFLSIRQLRRLKSLIRRFRFHFLVLVCKLNAWRENEKEIITGRMQMQLAVRELVNSVLITNKEDAFIKEVERCVPGIVCRTDSKRILRRLETGDFIPLTRQRLLDCREEIL